MMYEQSVRLGTTMGYHSWIVKTSHKGDEDKVDSARPSNIHFAIDDTSSHNDEVTDDNE